MSYVQVVASTIVANSEGSLPASARRLDNQQWVMGLATASTTLQQACGWYAVTATLRPADTATLTYDRSITLPGGVPTETWTQRAKTQAELDADRRAANTATMTGLADLTTKIAALRSFFTDPDVVAIDGLANATMPTAQQLNRWVKAVDTELRRCVNHLDRLTKLVTGGQNPTLLDDITNT